jgi:hypothetical protein
MKKLTPKQEAFANKYVECGNASEAYRQSYDTKAMSKEVVWKEASLLLSDRNVTVRVVELKNELGKRYKIEQGFIIQTYLEIINDVDYTFDLGKLAGLDKEEKARFFRMMQQTKNTDKLRAAESLAKMLGLNEPDKLNVQTKDITHTTKWGS